MLSSRNRQNGLIEFLEISTAGYRLMPTSTRKRTNFSPSWQGMTEAISTSVLYLETIQAKNSIRKRAKEPTVRAW